MMVRLLFLEQGDTVLQQDLRVVLRHGGSGGGHGFHTQWHATGFVPGVVCD